MAVCKCGQVTEHMYSMWALYLPMSDPPYYSTSVCLNFLIWDIFLNENDNLIVLLWGVNELKHEKHFRIDLELSKYLMN